VTLRTAGAVVDEQEMGLFRSIQQVLADPNVAFLLLSIGTLGLIYELASPGIGVGAVLGLTFVTLGLFGLAVLSVNLVGVIFLLLAAALFVAEVFAPGLGLAAAGGAFALVLSGIFLFDDAPGLQISLAVVLPGAIVVALFVIIAGRFAMRARRAPSTTTGAGLFVGRTLTVRALHGRPQVFVEGRGGASGRATRVRCSSTAPRSRWSTSTGLALVVDPAVGRRLRPVRPADHPAGHPAHTATPSATPPRHRPSRHPADNPKEPHERSTPLRHRRRGPRVVLLLVAAIKIVNEYERGVIFRLGRVIGAKGPGLFFIIPIIDKMVKVNLQTVTADIPPQDVITKDNVTLRVNAVTYFNVVDPVRAVVAVQNYLIATSQIAQTTLRSILGQVELDDLLIKRDDINAELQQIIDGVTDPWGVKVTLVEVKDVELPEGMRRAMGRQAEAERDRRAKVIHARGELEAASSLREAAETSNATPASMQLRLLSTMSEVSAEKNSTLIFPVPVELLRFAERMAGSPSSHRVADPELPTTRRRGRR
jgi:regulator of protease activity HflC (stomatin/prohibitin superfamily)